MHLTEEQFFRLTPKLLQILSERKYANDRRELANSALIATSIINVNRPKNRRALKIEDIIGKEKKENEEVELTDFMKMLADKSKKR